MCDFSIHTPWSVKKCYSICINCITGRSTYVSTSHYSVRIVIYKHAHTHVCMCVYVYGTRYTSQHGCSVDDSYVVHKFM